MQRPKNEEERRRLLERLKADFFLPPLLEHKYKLEQVIGEGSYGVVCSATNVETGEKVAVKRIMRVFEEAPEATRTLRELKFLRLLKPHENIITIKDVLLPSDRDRFDDVFVVLELMPTDLTRVLRSKIELSGEHIRWLVFQLIRGIYYIHTSRVFHRDLKPSNILINAQCDLRIVDFGLSRAAFDNPEPDIIFWTDYVATRWYRAPELIMGTGTNYTTAIDMWSIGCIFGEMLNKGHAMFPGHNPDDQLKRILDVCGSPPNELIAAVRDPNMREQLTRAHGRPGRPMRQLFPHADPMAVDLLEKILEFDPAKRITAEKALQLPYLQMDTVTRGNPIDMEEFAFERKSHSIAELRNLFLEEILKYHPERRGLYMNPNDQPVLRYAPVDQAARFRDAMRASQNGTEPPREWESMPNQRFTNYYEDAVGSTYPNPSYHNQAVSNARPDVDPNDMLTDTTTANTKARATAAVSSHPYSSVAQTTGTIPGEQCKPEEHPIHHQDASMTYEEPQLMRYSKLSSVESASSAMTFRQDPEQLLAATTDRRVSETLDSVMDAAQDLVTDPTDQLTT